jgi:hypothetical protein
VDLYAVFLYGVNIPGGLWLTAQEVERRVGRLNAATFAGIVGRPDSLLLWSTAATTEEALRRAVTEAVGCPCVILPAATLERIADGALGALRASGDGCMPPYRHVLDSVEWEWCLVLSSEPLPADATGGVWLFRATQNAVAVAVLERRALLARKRRRTPNGGRVMLGAVLNDPWARTLREHGVAITCLTSRTLNRVGQAARAARLEGAGRPDDT